MIIAGEASGDMHAARMVRATLKIDSDISFFGIGGKDMRAAGVEILVDAAEMAVVGLVEVLKHYPRLSGVLKQMQRILHDDPPDLLILVDYPGFNLRLAPTAKQAGVQVLYYISPQVWAWNQKRVHKIRQYVDMMAVVFQFEEDFFRQHNVPVKYVGHPLIDELSEVDPSSPDFSKFNLDAHRPVVGLFPGSRKSELKRLLPVILETAELLRRYSPEIQFILPLASTLNIQDLFDNGASEKKLTDVSVVQGNSREIIPLCTSIITASGTVTLEIALRKIPMVIIYRVAFFTYEIVRRLLKIKFIGLCNIVAGKKIVPELIQHDATSEKIFATTRKLLEDNQYREEICRELSTVRRNLPDPVPENKVENVVVRMLSA